MIRYLVERVKLDAKHPQWPGEEVFKWLDRNDGSFSWGCCLNEELAQEICARLNKGLRGIER